MTAQSSFDSVSGQNISRSWSYTLPNGSVNGNVVTVTDSNQNVTKTFYDSLNNLYPIETDEAYQQTAQRKTMLSYDFNSGLLSSSIDVDNGLAITYTYDDIGRRTKVEQSGNGPLYRSISINFDDLALSATTTQVQTGLTTTIYFDALGRVRLTSDTAGKKTQHAYRFGTAGDSFELVSNAYGSADQITGWTLTTRNSISATTTVKTFKGADAPGPLTFAGTPPPAQWGDNTASTGTTTIVAHDPSTATCSGPTTDVRDQASHTTNYCADALGRLASVTDATGNVTQHTYDLLDDLVQVVQSGQTRAFKYSSLGRLTKACNPETGTADCTASPLPASGLESYTYDANGNLKTKTDAKSVTITFDGYDGLNRPQTKSYTRSDGSAEGTPPVTFGYDQGGWKGALSSVTTSVSSTSYTYDGLGRIQTSTQTTAPAPGLSFVYSYSLADQLTQIQYPSNRIVSYTPDGAGRISAVRNGTSGPYYARDIAYTPAGGISALTLGNSVTEQWSWNDRLQLTGIAAAAPQTGANLWTIRLYPCPGPGLNTSCDTGNVGNIQAQTIALPGLSLTQSYTYDVLGRIKSIGEGTGNRSRNYDYDAAGNQFVVANGASDFEISPFTPLGTSNFDGRNRLYVNNSTYDPSGTGTQTAIGGYAYAWDAENRLTGAYLGGNGTDISNSAYLYDGQGQRVQKIICPSDPTNGNQSGPQSCTSSTTGADTTTYVYDAFGNLAAEYESSTQNLWSACGTATCYISVDQIGSTRLVTDNSANVTQRYDYLPFGEEIWAGFDGRATDMGYQPGPDGFNPKFTGQYRDTENFLDYFNARYYSPQQGRFASPDPGNAGADPAKPQTWNGYTYVSNNPLNLTDPDGLGFWSVLGSILEQFFTLGFGGGIGSLPTIPNIGGVNSGPWNEQWPMGGGGFGGGLNTGGVFGSGNTGPFVFSISPDEQILLDAMGGLGRGAGIQSPFWSTVGYFINWVTGTGPRSRYYGPKDFRTVDFMKSAGFQRNMMDIAAACRSGITSGTVSLPTFEGGYNLPYDLRNSPVGAEVGGYDKGTWATNGNEIHMTVRNDSGTKSFFYGKAPNSPFSVGPMRTIHQKFDINVPNPCAAR